MLLNVGCGEFPADGWCNIDLHDQRGPRPDVIGSILVLPFQDRTAERVYLGHVLEHVAWDELPRALAEVRRVLAADGRVMVVGPDLNLTIVHEPVLLGGVKFGGRRWSGDEHQWVATGERTLEAMLDAGFDAELIPIADVAADWPIVGRDPWQFAIQAKPKE